MSKRGNGKKRRVSRSRGGQKLSQIRDIHLEEQLCDCGCGTTQLMDVGHGQRYIKGHGGKGLWKRRREALIQAIASIFQMHGVISLQRALAGARWCVDQSLERAKKAMQAFGWTYETMEWRAAL